MVLEPVTNFWSPGTEDQVAVGYYNKGLHAAWSVFNGKTMAASNTGSFNNIANWAATLSYETPIQEIQSKFGISYLNGIVGDLLGNTSHVVTTHHKGLYRNPAGIIFGKIKYKALTLSGLYQQAFKENNFVIAPISDNYKPRSWGATAKVDFKMMNRANWVALNYSWQRITKKALNNKSEEDQILVGWNIALTKSISASLQYGRLKDKYKYFINAINTYNVVNLGLYAYF